MKRLLKRCGIAALILCLCLAFTACNEVLVFGGLPGVNREPAHFADSVWRTDDGSLTVYGTGNGESAKGIYRYGGKTTELYIEFNDLGDATVYDCAIPYDDVADNDIVSEVWEVDFVNYDYHGYLEIERSQYFDGSVCVALNPLFKSKKPIKLRHIKNETIPEESVLSENSHYKIFKTDSLFGIKVFNKSGKVILSELTAKEPLAKETKNNLLDLVIEDYMGVYHRFIDPASGQVSRSMMYGATMYDVAENLVAYIETDPTYLEIEEIFPDESIEIYEIPSAWVDLDFLKENITLTALRLIPQKNQVEVTYRTAENQTKTKTVPFEMAVPSEEVIEE